MDLTAFWDNLNHVNKHMEQKMTQDTQRNNGIYYTNPLLTDLMVNDLFHKIVEKHGNNTKSYIINAKFLEPCVGIGNFVFSYLKIIYTNFKLSQSDWKQIISNVYVADNSKNNLLVYLKLLKSFTNQVLNVAMPTGYKEHNIGYGLIYDSKIMNKRVITPKQYFGRNTFDIIITNPPYVNLRAQRRTFNNLNIFKRYKHYYRFIKQNLHNVFTYQGSGTPNIYKMFVEAIINSYLKSSGIADLLIPQQILKDKSTTAIRELIISNDLHLIRNFNENSQSVSAHQALSALLISKGRESTDIKMTTGFSNHFQLVKVQDIKNNPNLEILSLSPYEKRLVTSAKRFPKVSNLPFIINMRGELDISLNKMFITSNRTKHQLLKGRNVTKYQLKDLDKTDYVKKQFVQTTNKRKYINSIRLACPQISNMRSKDRLKFAVVPKGMILGNSLNFIKVNLNKYGINIYYLLGLFNSNVYEQLFETFSSNNHINNYNIDAFPIPINDNKFIKQVTMLAKKAIHNKKARIKINQLVSLMFTNKTSWINYNQIHALIVHIKEIFPMLKSKDINLVMSSHKKVNSLGRKYNFNKDQKRILKGLLTKYNYLTNNKVLNHNLFSLSHLDKEMVVHVRQGGNWKQIPLSVAKKSKRLMKIRHTGGRTTLYGRLRYDEPSYTITTYFNRPGNGANIHPVHNRTLSVREASRIQSFPDDYYFLGTQRDKLNQVGNAVPSFISYQIGTNLKKYLNVRNSLDLFSGAGGLTLGFILSGFHSVLANDIDHSALDTMKVNLPNLKILTGDINDQKIFNKIVSISKRDQVDIIDGGPPCQGFSLAGFRNLDDPRSKLVFAYVKVLSKVMPKAFVFENVTGLLSINKKKTFNELTKLFQKTGYNIHAKKLDFSDYGVPQKRKRVIIIGIRKDIKADIAKMFPTPTTRLDSDKITVYDAIGDLENVNLNKNEYYKVTPKSMFARMLKKDITPQQYLNYLENE